MPDPCPATQHDIERLDRNLEDLRKELRNDIDAQCSLLREISNKVSAYVVTCVERQKDLSDLTARVDDHDERISSLEDLRKTADAQRKAILWLIRLLYGLGGAGGSIAVYKIIIAALGGDS